MHFQRGQPRTQRGVDVGQRQVGSGARDFCPVDIDPCTHGARSLGHFKPQISMAAQTGHVNPLKRRVNLAAPIAPLAVAKGQKRLLEHAHGIEPAPEPGLGRGVEPQGVVEKAVAHD